MQHFTVLGGCTRNFDSCLCVGPPPRLLEEACRCCARSVPVVRTRILSDPLFGFFFHEYGRRVGMVPRSSLKGGKNSQMVEKGTEKPNTTPNKQNTTTQGPEAESPPSCSLFSVQGETCETRKSARKGPELKNEKHIAGLCSSKVAKRLQKDFTSPL